MSLNGLFLSFSALCDFLKNTFFRKKNFKFFLKKIIFPNVSNSCSLNIFEPKIWRRLGTFPSCFSSDYNLHTDRSTFLTILKSYNSYLANLKDWRKSLRSSIFTSSKKLKGTKGYSTPSVVFSALWDLFSKKKFPKGSPFNFLEFSDRTYVEKSPFQFFRHCETFFQKVFFSPKVPLLQFFWWFATEWMKNLKVSPLVRQFGSTFRFFRYRRREYFDTLKCFCCFWALDMAPTWAVPGLFFFFSWQSHSEWSTFLQSFVHLFNQFSEKQEIVGSILALNHKFFMLPKVQARLKGSPFGFFRYYATFFRKFSNSIKGLHFLKFSVRKNV